MCIRTGIDIIEVKRIKETIERFEEKFLSRVFTEKERKYCEDKNAQKFQSYAARFAAKEAIFKAVSEKLENKFDIEWREIEILNDKNGRPLVYLYGRLSECVGEDCKIDLSISHVAEMAVASCVAQFKS